MPPMPVYIYKDRYTGLFCLLPPLLLPQIALTLRRPVRPLVLPCRHWCRALVSFLQLQLSTFILHHYFL